MSPEDIRAALDAIPPDMPRDEWARVGMALKSELGADGFELFNTWSQRGESYDAKATRDTWKSIKASGRVTVGTLLHLAKSHGFRWDESKRKPAQNPEERQALAKARSDREQRERTEREKAQRDAAAEAARLWSEAATEGDSPYLVRKGVQGHGVRYAAEGWLLVPMCDAAGELWNVQRIAPGRPAGRSAGRSKKGAFDRSIDRPEKLYLKGGRKSGLWHLIGELGDASALLVAEGYATAATVHEATGRPVAVAFDAGNLTHVARELRKVYRPGLVLICGDDDRETEARTGRNPGREKARAAADKVRGAAVWPEGLPEGGSDFNDLAQHAGLDAVRECIEAAIAAAIQARQGASGAKARGAQGPAGESAPEAPDSSPGGPGLGLGDRFTVDAGGVSYTGADSGGPIWVCARLEVPALTRDADGGGWGYLLEFTDPAGNPRQWVMPARMLAGDGNEFRAVLLSLGLRIAANAKARGYLAQYVQSRRPGEFATCTDRLGWHGHAFVLPGETLGDAGERIVYQTDGAAEHTLRERGTLAQWRERVACLAVGNSRLAFAIACAFAGPMLRPAAIDSGGFHLRGDSSCGKTTALRVAASVYGGASYMQRWRATDNALETIAAQHCDGLLILDELAQVDPKVAGECAYMLANETSKARSTRTGQGRPRLSWRLLFLSAGEIGLAAHMAEGNKRARVGQELRMADVPADAGSGMGLFEQLHDFEGGAALAQHLGKACDAFHGTAGRAWLEWATTHSETLRERMRAGVERIATQWIPEGASGQVQRVGRRFAIVATAGDLAAEAGITGWPEGEASRAARACFHAWLESRGGIGNAEEAQMLRQVQRFFEAHGESRFTDWNRADGDHAPKTLHRAGFRKAIKDASGEAMTWDYFVFMETFRQEVCQGFESKAVLRVLRERGHLVIDKGRSFDCRARLPGQGMMNCYRIKSSVLDSEADG